MTANAAAWWDEENNCFMESRKDYADPTREIAEEIAARTQSEVVQVVGGSLIFFKENPELHEPKDKKKKTVTGTKNPNRPSVRKKIHEKKLAEERKTAARRKAERNFRRKGDV